MSNTQPKIVCDNISKTFIQKGTQMVPVLEKVSLEVRDQEFLVILGPGSAAKLPCCGASQAWNVRTLVRSA